MGAGEAMGGAASGAAKGAMFGPWGAAIGGGLGLLGGIFGSRGRDKMAKAAARNENKMNKWRHKFQGAEWQGERGWQQRKRGKSNAYRSQLLAAIMGNPKYGLSKLFPGFAPMAQKYEGTDQALGVVDPHAAAGPPPELEAQTGGFGAALGAGVGGAMQGATTGAQVGNMIAGR